VERDAATLQSVRTAEETAARRIDPRTVDDPGCAEALDRIDRAGLSAAIWDMTSDIGIPAFSCLITGLGRFPVAEHAGDGMGCHPDRNVALSRALTEAAQCRLGLISGARDDPAGWEYRGPEPALGPEDPGGDAARDFTSVPAFDGDSFDADVAWELAALQSTGITEVVTVDLTQEEFGIPVVRVIIPGLEGPTTTIPNCAIGPRAAELIGDR
jgi:ribosomal protein S12 methylthiotransferase accessory factor YcaO